MYPEKIGECNLMYCTKSVHLLEMKKLMCLMVHIIINVC